MYRMFDLAYYPGPQLVDVALANGVQAIGGYVYDPFVADSGGYVGGWSADVIGALERAGLLFIPIFTMRPGQTAPLTPERCLEVLQAIPRNTDLVAIDVESGSDPGAVYLAAWAPAMRQGGYRAIEYGSTSTEARDVGTGSLTWGASYIRTGWDDSLDPGARGWDAWQYAGSVEVAGVTVDLTNSMIPLAATPAQEDDMLGMIVGSSEGTDWVIWPSGYRIGLTSLADLEALKATGQFASGGQLSDAQLKLIPILPATSP